MVEAARTLAMGQDEATGAGRPTVDAPFGKALVEIAGRQANIVGLSADLAKYTDILPFRDAFPERFFNIGMAEQNLIAVAAGLARTGHVPFATTYGVFATRRAYDFVAIDCAHSKLNVKIVAGLPGLTTGYGGTHQAIEDLALMRMIPGLVVIDPCDATETAQERRRPPTTTARSICGFCAARSRSCSIPRLTASRSAGRSSFAKARTSASSRPA